MRASPAPTRLPSAVLLFAAASFLNEVSAQMVVPLIPILLASVLAAGPIALGAVEGFADAVAAMLKLWSGRRADIHPQHRKPMVVIGYGLAILARPLMAVAGSWIAVAALRGTDRLAKGIRGAPRDAILGDATPVDWQGRAYGLNRAMDYAGAVVGTLLAAAALAWSGLGITQVIAWSAVPGLAVLILLMRLPMPSHTAVIDTAMPVVRRLSWSALSPALKRYLQVLALSCFARASETFIVLRGYELGMPTVHLLLLWAWLATAQMISAYLGAPISDRMSKRTLTMFNWASLAIGYVALAVAFNSFSLWFAVTVYGLFSGISEGVERSLVSEFARKGEKGSAFGWYYMVTGLAAIPAALLFGLIWSVAGAGLAFGLAAVASLSSAAWLGLRPP